MTQTAVDRSQLLMRWDDDGTLQLTLITYDYVHTRRGDDLLSSTRKCRRCRFGQHVAIRTASAAVQPPGPRTSALRAGWGQHIAIGMATERSGSNRQLLSNEEGESRPTAAIPMEDPYCSCKAPAHPRGSAGCGTSRGPSCKRGCCQQEIECCGTER